MGHPGQIEDRDSDLANWDFFGKVGGCEEERLRQQSLSFILSFYVWGWVGVGRNFVFLLRAWATFVMMGHRGTQTQVQPRVAQALAVSLGRGCFNY